MFQSSLIFVFIVVLFCFYTQIQSAPSEDKITNLPGLNFSINFEQYAGYVTVDEENNRNLFYWFVTSETNPKESPVLVWCNGGPGASSLLGFFSELGPFRPTPDGKSLTLNPYRWNKIANIIFLEAPAGVGFSYSDVKADYTTNDNKTASDNFKFLNGWFKKFPEFKENDFYVTGESYGGHYVPQLANMILEGNKNGLSDINIKGLAVGNPGTENDWYYNTDEYAFITFMYSHGLVPQAAYMDCYQNCGWSDFLTNCSKDFTHPSASCKAATNRAYSYIPTNDIDFYNVYADVCKESKENLLDFSPYLAQTPFFSSIKGEPFYPCITNYLTLYLNIPDVQDAIHAKRTDWTWVSNKINYVNESMIITPYYTKFAKEAPNWRILVFSGDMDSSVPFLGTQRWIKCLGQAVMKDWTTWYTDEEQIGGNYITYEHITFLTIHGSGHMVPYYTPEKGYTFFEKWLNNKL